MPCRSSVSNLLSSFSFAVFSVLACCSDGVDITDAEGNVIGKSVAAGRSALAQVALTRVALPLPSTSGVSCPSVGGAFRGCDVF